MNRYQEQTSFAKLLMAAKKYKNAYAVLKKSYDELDSLNTMDNIRLTLIDEIQKMWQRH